MEFHDRVATPAYNHLLAAVAAETSHDDLVDAVGGQGSAAAGLKARFHRCDVPRFFNAEPRHRARPGSAAE